MNKKRVISMMIILAIMMSGLIVPSVKKGSAITDNCDLIPFTVKYGQTEARSMLSMINSFRTGPDAWFYDDNNNKTYVSDLGELQYDYGLEKAAMKRAEEIALVFDHYRPNKMFCQTVMSEYGLAYNYYAENIAAGDRTASDVFVGWREDNESASGQGHRRNMLSKRAKYIGIGHVVSGGVHYWVQEFGDTASGTTVTPAEDGNVTVDLEVNTIRTCNRKLVYVGENELNTDISCGESLQLMNYRMGTYDTYTWPRRYIPTELFLDWSLVSGDDCVKLTLPTYPNDRVALVTGTGEGTFTVKGACLDGYWYDTISGTVHHKWDSGNIIKEATCTEPGQKELRCACGATDTEEIPALGHNEVILPAVEPTIYQEGLTEGKMCSRCGEILVEQEKIPKLKSDEDPGQDHGDGDFDYSDDTDYTDEDYQDEIPKLVRIKLKSLKNVKTKKVIIKVSKDSKANGYQLQYSLKKDFSSRKNKYFASTKLTIKNLKKKMYYVRARSYCFHAGTTYYGTWSKVKKVKVKK